MPAGFSTSRGECLRLHLWGPGNPVPSPQSVYGERKIINAIARLAGVCAILVRERAIKWLMRFETAKAYKDR